MVCIYCGSATSVGNSRPQRSNNRVWRRRQCLACASIFTTIEQADLSVGFVVRSKEEHRLMPFDRDQLFLSIYKSCKHRLQALNESTALTQTIINKLLPGAKDGMIERTAIAKQAYKVLKQFDQTAATVYAAYHDVQTG